MIVWPREITTSGSYNTSMPHGGTVSSAPGTVSERLAHMVYNVVRLDVVSEDPAAFERSYLSIIVADFPFPQLRGVPGGDRKRELVEWC